MTETRRDIPRSGEDATLDYRRTARRLRARDGRDLETLHRSLRVAAAKFDARRNSAPLEPPPAAELFQHVVARRVHGPVLRYSLRLELISIAAKLGVRRFEANLIIATQQHRARDLSTALWSERSATTERRRRMVAAGLVVACLQSLIVWGAWHVVGQAFG